MNEEIVFDVAWAGDLEKLVYSIYDIFAIPNDRCIKYAYAADYYVKYCSLDYV